MTEDIVKKDYNVVVKNIFKLSIHALQLYSYLFYFVLLLLGILLDFIFHIGIPIQSVLLPTSISFLIVASVLILWAQRSTRNLDKENLTKETFSSGPYFFTKNPTHLGLFLLVLGFGILSNAFFVVVFTIISYLVTKFVFLKKEEKILEAKYGDPYLEYKKSVKF
ncbi:MAG: methyltransferase [Minisyncoccia bacterium]